MKRLYVVRFASGVIKAGITTCFRQRARALAAAFGRIVDSSVSQTVDGRGAESALLRRLCVIGARRGSGETFENVSFKTAEQLMRQVASRKLSARGLAPRRVPPPTTLSICGSEIAFSGGVRLLVIDGRLVVAHPKLAERVPVDKAQLERWLLRQLREAVV